MVRRALSFFLCLFAGAVSAYWFLALGTLLENALAGTVGASVLWFLIDLRQANRFLAWLRVSKTVQIAGLNGWWGEAAERMRRLLRQHEEQLKSREVRLQEFLAAMQASPNGVVLLDATNRIEWCNQMAVEHFGLDAERDLQQHIGNLVRDPLFAAYQSAPDYTRDLLIAGSASSSRRPVRLSVQFFRYGEGHKMLMSRDITAIEQAEAMRRDFVANVSHEIRTPLTVLSGFVETLQTLPVDAAQRAHYLELMSQQAQRMQALVEDLLTLSRLEGSMPPGMDDWVDVGRLIEQCAQEGRSLSTLMSEAGHQIDVDVQSDSQLAGSRTELHSAMSNLVINAIRHTPSGGKFRLGWNVDAQGQGTFSVCDSGPGIAPEHLARLTERFYRVDRSRSRETGGTGLGLAIVKHVAQRHGAQLRIESCPGQGANFTLVFPASRVRGAVGLESSCL
ncbi:MAG: phosphate regulon sensor histidine kinase PhoR [Burkholderiaceae bacterium]